MFCAAWPHVRGDLALTRRGAAGFIDDLERIYCMSDRRSWVARWINIGNAHCLVGDRSIEKGAIDEATESWLCALTAFEVARRLVDEEDPQSENILAKIEGSIQIFGSLELKTEPIRIACSDQTTFLAYYVPVSGRNSCGPAVICISREEETAATLLGRLLPALINRGISVLVVSHEDVSSHRRGQSASLLSSCLDYLQVRPDVDVTRIGVYGEGLSAALATDFAVSDPRVAAASCDGGLWNWTRTHASIGWITRTDRTDENLLSSCRSRLIQKLRCPVLVVAGGRSILSATEAIKLQAECKSARIDVDVALPRISRTPAGEIENFVTTDDSVLEWLEHKLTRNSTS